MSDSNTARLLVANVTAKGAVLPVDEERAYLRLGAEIERTGTLGREKIEEAAVTCRAFARASSSTAPSASRCSSLLRGVRAQPFRADLGARRGDVGAGACPHGRERGPARLRRRACPRGRRSPGGRRRGRRRRRLDRARRRDAAARRRVGSLRRPRLAPPYPRAPADDPPLPRDLGRTRSGCGGTRRHQPSLARPRPRRRRQCPCARRSSSAAASTPTSSSGRRSSFPAGPPPRRRARSGSGPTERRRCSRALCSSRARADCSGRSSCSGEAACARAPRSRSPEPRGDASGVKSAGEAARFPLVRGFSLSPSSRAPPFSSSPRARRRHPSRR